MTNNEAAKWIQLYIDLAKIDPTTGEAAYLNDDKKKTIEAMEMAVNTLIREVCNADEPTCNELARNLQPCKQDDLIERARAIEIIHELQDSQTIDQTADNAYDLVEWAISEIPSAQADTKELSFTRNALDTISRQDAIDALAKFVPYAICDESTESYTNGLTDAYNLILQMPSAQPEPKPDKNGSEPFGNAEMLGDRTTDDCISRQAAIDAIDKIFPADPMRNDYTQGITCGAALAEEYIKQLPSAQPEIIRCGQCKYAEVADKEDAQDGYTCQFHRGSVWFSGSYCSWAERRTDGVDS